VGCEMEKPRGLGLKKLGRLWGVSETEGKALTTRKGKGVEVPQRKNEMK